MDCTRCSAQNEGTSCKTNALWYTKNFSCTGKILLEVSVEVWKHSCWGRVVVAIVVGALFMLSCVGGGHFNNSLTRLVVCLGSLRNIVGVIQCHCFVVEVQSVLQRDHDVQKMWRWVKMKLKMRLSIWVQPIFVWKSAVRFASRGRGRNMNF